MKSVSFYRTIKTFKGTLPYNKYESWYTKQLWELRSQEIVIRKALLQKTHPVHPQTNHRPSIGPFRTNHSVDRCCQPQSPPHTSASGDTLHLCQSSVCGLQPLILSSLSVCTPRCFHCRYPAQFLTNVKQHVQLGSHMWGLHSHDHPIIAPSFIFRPPAMHHSQCPPPPPPLL